MSGLRLLLVTRRFWPQVGGAEVSMANLAAELERQGHTATILTARWHPSWPTEITHQGVRVVRLPQPAMRFVGTIRYLAEMRRWVQKNRRQFDLAYVAMLKHSAYAMVGLGQRLRFPVVLRPACAGLTGDVHWQLDARFGRQIKRRCFQASALVSISHSIERELIAAGYPRDRLHYIPSGVIIPPPRTASGQQAARAALADSQPALALSDRAPLIVYTGRLAEVKGLQHLMQAFASLVPRFPLARLWIVGEGPLHAALAQQVVDAGLSGRVVLPGRFDDVEDVLAAADIFVLPSREEGMSRALLEAMAAGLPAVVSDIPSNAEMVEDGVHGLRIPYGEPPRFAEALTKMLSEPEWAAARGAQGRQRAERDWTLAGVVKSHITLFERLLAV